MKRTELTWMLVAATIVVAPGAAVAPGLLGPTDHAYASSFTVDSNFRANALQSVQQQEPGYISNNDCTHWLSYFLNQTYGMSTNIMRDYTPDGLDVHTDDLVLDLISDGDAQVITGDGSFDAGGFISPDAARQVFASLDSQMLENGGSREFIVAYHWSYDGWPGTTTPDGYPGGESASHLAVYVGNGQVVSHGVTNEADETPRSWDWFYSIDSVAIIALTNTTGDSAGSGGNPPGAYPLGGVDLNGYCQSLGYAGVSLDGTTAYDWHCDDIYGGWNAIDMTAACQWQYPGAANVSAQLGNMNNPDSWVCYGVYVSFSERARLIRAVPSFILRGLKARPRGTPPLTTSQAQSYGASSTATGYARLLRSSGLAI